MHPLLEEEEEEPEEEETQIIGIQSRPVVASQQTGLPPTHPGVRVGSEQPGWQPDGQSILGP